jgi:hypothetical protein
MSRNSPSPFIYPSTNSCPLYDTTPSLLSVPYHSLNTVPRYPSFMSISYHVTNTGPHKWTYIPLCLATDDTVSSPLQTSVTLTTFHELHSKPERVQDPASFYSAIMTLGFLLSLWSSFSLSYAHVCHQLLPVHNGLSVSEIFGGTTRSEIAGGAALLTYYD